MENKILKSIIFECIKEVIDNQLTTQDILISSEGPTLLLTTHMKSIKKLVNNMIIKNY